MPQAECPEQGFSSAVSLIQLAFFPPLLWYTPLGPLQYGWHQQQYCQNTAALSVPEGSKTISLYSCSSHSKCRLLMTDAAQKAVNVHDMYLLTVICSLLRCPSSSRVAGWGSPLTLYFLVLITFPLPTASTSLLSEVCV